MARDWSRRLRPVAGALVALALAAVAVVALPGRAPEGPPDAAPTRDDGAATPSPAGAAPADEVVDIRDLTADQPPDTTPAVAFTGTGIAGGGFQNVVAFDPQGDTVLLGGDNSGLHRSTDGGVTWLPVGAGLPPWSTKVAAVAFDPDDPAVAVAVGGFGGVTGGVLRSEDNGRTWAVASEALAFSGANTPNVAALPRTHPRATGDLLLWLDGVLFAATFDDGVHRSTDGGRSWEPIGVGGPFLRGLAVDDQERLLVATRGDGLWRIADPTGAATAERVPGGPDVVEEVAVAGDVVLAAADTEGLWQLGPDGQWRRLLAIDAQVTTVEVGGDTWWVGTHRPAGDAGGVLTSDDRGRTWERTATGDGLRPVVAGTGTRWWVADAQRSFLPDGGGWTAAHVAVDPSDPATVLVAGRAGAWRTTDGGATWRAAVAGLEVTAHDHTAVAADGRIATANTDHRLLVSDDGLRTVTAVEPGATKGTAVAADVTGPPGTLLVATAERDANTDGELYRLAAGSTDAESLGLAAEVGGRRVMAVASGFDGDTPVVLAAVEERGLWRLDDTGWHQVPAAAFADTQESPEGRLLWPAGSSTIHALDRASGLWRSDDAGRSWTPLRRLELANGRNDPEGFLTADPEDPTRRWLSLGDSLVALHDEGSDVEVPLAGPVLALADGGLVVVTRDAPGVAPTLRHVCGDTVTQVATGERFRGGALDAVDLDLDGAGHLVLTSSNGLLRSAAPIASVLQCGGATAP